MNNKIKNLSAVRQELKIISIVFFVTFFCFGFSGEVKAEDPQCCYGDRTYGSEKSSDYCVLASEPEAICKDKVTQASQYIPSIKYENIEENSCLKGNQKCLELLGTCNFGKKFVKNEYIAEVGDDIIIDFVGSTVTCLLEGNSSLKYSLFIKDEKENLKVDDSFLKAIDTDIVFDEYISNDPLSNLKEIKIDTKKLIENKNIKTLPYTFSLSLFMESDKQLNGKVYYDLKEVKIIIKGVNCSDKYPSDKDACNYNPFCAWGSVGAGCYDKYNPSVCEYFDMSECSGICEYSDTAGQCQSAITTEIEDTLGSEKPAGYDGILSDCAFRGNCKDVNEFLILGIGAVRWLFGIIGGLALVMFIYGGLMMIISFGNEEKIKQGKNALVAAVIGMIIAFGAYLLIKFIIDSLGIGPNFKIF